MVKKIFQVFSIFVVVFTIAAWWYIAGEIKRNRSNYSNLPFYGPDTTNAENFQVDKFNLINQFEDSISRKDFEDKIWVTDFFFSTCEGICPIMTMNLSKIQDTFRCNSHIKILSHTVDPTTDNSNTLLEYSKKYNALKGQWHFATGNKETIYHLARYSYFIASPKDSSIGEDFVHSQLIALIDPHLHIRGYYDGTNGKDIEKLIADIRKLQLEYPQVSEEINKRNWLEQFFKLKF